MRFIISSLALVGAAATGAIAQNASSSVCDKYTTALLKNNTAENQYTLLTLLVNTVVIGNYTTDPAPKNAVPGILAKGNFNGEEVNLLPYFDGTLLSTNRGGSKGVSVNFLDDGGAEPLKMNKPANGKDSQQYKLLTHLYQFFGSLLQCSTYGKDDAFPSYKGRDMAPSHAFMALSPSEVGYFVQQVGLAASSFGVSESDISAVATALNKLFGYRCSPPTTVLAERGPTLNSICQANECPLDEKAMCGLYPNNGTVMEPAVASMSGNGSVGGMPSGTGAGGSPSATGAPFTASAGHLQRGIGAVLGAIAFVFTI